MKSIEHLAMQNAGRPLAADDILEFHATRLLLLIRHCGVRSKLDGLERIDGLTKMAKLDFLVRYPEFFEKFADATGSSVAIVDSGVESSMIRFHYGPWDQRYYQILAFLESRKLIQVSKDGNKYVLGLTEAGKTITGKCDDRPSFGDIISHMKQVKKVAGHKAGSTLKMLIYQVFEKEVGDQKMGRTIS